MVEADLRALLEAWTWRLGLEQWRIVLKMGGVEDATSYMEVIRSTTYMRAVIHVQPWLLSGESVPEEAMFAAGDLDDRFVECSLVHELLHLHTRDMRAIVRDDLDGQVHRDVYSQFENSMSRAEEQAVDHLAVALVRAWREGRGL